MNYEQKKENRELRINNLEIRSDSTDDKLILEGYACVFEQETLIGDESWGWYEKIDRHAFDGCDFKDAALKYNHGDAKFILARIKNGSMTATPDDYGLFIRAELQGDISDHVDVYKAVKSQLLDKMSFAFTVAEEKYDESRKPVLRTITKIDKLWDAAIVDVPAYQGTSIYARSKELVESRLCGNRPSVESGEASVESDEKRQLELAKLKLQLIAEGGM